MVKIDLYKGDCLEVMDELIAKGVIVDAIITDPPYGTTACKWDSIIPFDEMWKRLNKLIKPNGAIVLFGSEPFSSALRMSNIKNYKYDWVWKKQKPTNFYQVKTQPLKEHENILVFSKEKVNYYPQGTVEVNIKNGRKNKSSNLYSNYDGGDYVQKIGNYPRSIQFVATEGDKNRKHPTQKPVALMEYLIKTYTNEGETVLDFTMGSGTTGVACVNTNRNFIGIELDENYFKIAEKRINENL
jgi:site-specific DNA-methyltransferase (adenine-specific)